MKVVIKNGSITNNLKICEWGGGFSDEGLAVCVLFSSFVLFGCYAVELFTPLFSRSAVRESIFCTLSARRCVEVPASVADHKTPPMGSHHTITQLKFILRF